MNRAILWGAFVLYCAVVAFGATVHEPWWDEAQAWLIARDSTAADFFLRHLAYEGHPPLWYLLLMIPAKLGLPYASLKVVAALAGIAGAYILLFHVRTLPVAVRALAPFTFYLAFQYTIVARSYVVLGATLWALAAIYEERARRFPLFVLLLGILSGVSVHGFALALGFAALFVIDAWRGHVSTADIPTRRGVVAVTAYLLWALLLVVVLWPPDGSSSAAADLYSPFSPARYVQLFAWIVPQLFWGEVAEGALLAARIVIAACLMVLLVWLARARFLFSFFVLSSAVLAVSAIYYSAWHEGLLFFVLLFSTAIAYGRTRDRALTHVVTALVVVLLLRHVSWTVASLRYDAAHEFTGSEEAARFIRERGIHERTLYALGTRNLELQPYFDANVFDNYPFPAGAMWDWSTTNPWPYPSTDGTRNHAMRDWYMANMRRQPEYVVCSFGFRNDHVYTMAIAREPRYRLLGTFRGRTFWKTKEVEVIAFQLFERIAPTPRMSSASAASAPPRKSALGR